MKETNYDDFIKNNRLRVHHQKRERAVYFDDEYYYKIWVMDWEHSRVVRHAFETGYYDETTVPAFDSIIVQDNHDLGYKVKKGKVIGGSKSSWETLIKATSHQQRD